MLSIIVVKAKNNIIGKNNQIIWNISDDKKRFKKITENHVIIMGRKTFENLDGLLPNRKHVVMTQNNVLKIENENVEIAHDVMDLKEYVNSDEECFVIGGAMIYNLLMPYVEKLYVTEIDKDFEGDSFFPKIKEEDWKEIERIEGPQDGEKNFKYEYVTYIRRN